jgi:hypothetical protein
MREVIADFGGSARGTHDDKREYREGCLRRRLNDGRAARRKRSAELAHDHRRGEVPRREDQAAGGGVSGARGQ